MRPCALLATGVGGQDVVKVTVMDYIRYTTLLVEGTCGVCTVLYIIIVYA